MVREGFCEWTFFNPDIARRVKGVHCSVLMPYLIVMSLTVLIDKQRLTNRYSRVDGPW